MASIPPNFTDLNSALKRPNVECNIMGVVTDFLAPGRSRGTDWMCSFSITDLSYSGICDDGLKIRFFRAMETELPTIKGTGDVVLLRGIKINQWSGMTIGLSTRTTSWVVFPAASIPEKATSVNPQLEYAKEPRAPPPSVAEMRYAVSLCNSRDRSGFTAPISQPTSTAIAPSIINSSANQPSRDKFSLVKDVKVEKYCDLVGQVVKVYAHNNRVELYITDYTSNTLLFNYEWGQDDVDGSGREGDIYNYAPRHSTIRKWSGPPGYRTLTVTLWPPHSHFAQQNVKEDDFVHLRNVHIKWSKDSKIEGGLHSDRRYPERVDVTLLRNLEHDDRVKDVLRRKRDLSKKFQAQKDAFVAQARAEKRKGMEDEKPLSKTAARKKRKLEKERLEKTKSRQTEDLDSTKNHAPRAQAVDNPSLLKNNKDDLNNNVHCSHHLITPRSLSSILSLEKHTNTTPKGTAYTLPFQNINSRAIVRIIGFFPSELADFAVPCPKSSEYDILSDHTQSETESHTNTPISTTPSETGAERRWEWRFGLVLEDALGPKNEAKAIMEVYVAGPDAECLLKLDAEDLRKSATALANLREKLFLLWGDLEERSAQELSPLKQIDGNSHSPRGHDKPKSRPFHCCIKEYGVKKRPKQTIQEMDNGSGNDSGNDGGSESGSQSEHESMYAERNWIWERRWRLFGCTII